MLSEGIKERRQRMEAFQKKIDKVTNDVFFTKWHIEYSSRQYTRFRAS